VTDLSALPIGRADFSVPGKIKESLMGIALIFKPVSITIRTVIFIHGGSEDERKKAALYHDRTGACAGAGRLRK
jgi:hypothetical protein